MTFAVDLHTHSIASPDGGLALEDYARMLRTGPLTHIAITDHNRIDFAQTAHARLGAAIIVGEEIATTGGEIIGLFLRTPVPAGLPLDEAVRQIHAQNGLVYVPHPFETVRRGVNPHALDSIADMVDIVETHNGRALFQNRGRQAEAWAAAHECATAASSDAHGRRGWGTAYSGIAAAPNAAMLVSLLHSGVRHAGTVGVRGAFYPKYNRLRKRLSHA